MARLFDVEGLPARRAEPDISLKVVFAFVGFKNKIGKYVQVGSILEGQVRCAPRIRLLLIRSPSPSPSTRVPGNAGADATAGAFFVLVRAAARWIPDLRCAPAGMTVLEGPEHPVGAPASEPGPTGTLGSPVMISSIGAAVLAARSLGGGGQTSFPNRSCRPNVRFPNAPVAATPAACEAGICARRPSPARRPVCAPLRPWSRRPSWSGA